MTGIRRATSRHRWGGSSQLGGLHNRPFRICALYSHRCEGITTCQVCVKGVSKCIKSYKKNVLWVDGTGTAERNHLPLEQQQHPRLRVYQHHRFSQNSNAVHSLVDENPPDMSMFM